MEKVVVYSRLSIQWMGQNVALMKSFLMEAILSMSKKKSLKAIL